VLASATDDIVDRSIDEFEYHADMARWMGYGSEWHDHGFKINIHLSGKGGPDKFLKTLDRLSPEARNLIAIENDEITHGLDSVLLISHRVPITLDIHHHWVKTGEYISPDDARAQRVLDSWRGVRPVIHYSVSREDILGEHSRHTRPSLQTLLDAGYKKAKLRAHSDFYWNQDVNTWAGTFTDDFDIMCESKGKNLASFEFAAKIKAR
jgi:UV DNA damage repair endonuclease